MILYHCTTTRKIDKYKKTGYIMSPVRGWNNIESAQKWCIKTGRDKILKLECNTAYPLPDHRPLYHSYWTPENINTWEEVK